jgi:hypothetical protein
MANFIITQLIEWNRVDIVSDYIFNGLWPGLEDFKMGKFLKPYFMTDAIKLDRFEFVNLLLQNGFSLNMYLTNKQLLDLYRHVGSKKTFLIKS